MTPGFQQKQIPVLTGDGLQDVLLGSLVYLGRAGTLYRCPIGGTTDGLSVPRIAQNLIPPTGGIWMSGVLHDSGYRNQLEKWDGTKWILANLTRAQCDALMLEAMESQGSSWAKRQAIYRVLRLFGATAFNDNRSPAGLRRNQLLPVEAA